VSYLFERNKNMDKILDFIVYAFRCVILLFTAMLGHGEVIDNWLKDTIVGVVTLCLVILMLFFIDRLTVKIYRKKRFKVKN
jgi:high-affinity Fe2+/Pb2+ permease